MDFLNNKSYERTIREGLVISYETSHYLCGAHNFKINSADADIDDFGRMCDEAPENAPEYGCGNYGFSATPYPEDALQKYGISQRDFDVIVEYLEEDLHRGMCALCA